MVGYRIDALPLRCVRDLDVMGGRVDLVSWGVLVWQGRSLKHRAANGHIHLAVDQPEAFDRQRRLAH